MKQYDAVEKISKAMIVDGIVSAICLKGSLARGTEDEYSNVDLYTIVSDENYENFMARRLNYLQAYMPIVHSSFTMQQYPQIICVYENGLYLNLYTCKIQELNMVDDLAIIYDPQHLLSAYEKIPLSYSPTEIGSLLDKFLLTSLEYYNSYMRGDYLYSFHLASHLFAHLGTFLRIKFDPDFAKLGIKQFNQHIDTQMKNKFYEIARRLRYDTHLESVKMLYIIMDNYINTIPIAIAEYINFDFYQFVRRKIMSINL